MANENIKFTGQAPLVAQVDTFTPANVADTNTFTLTITGPDGRTHAITVTAGPADTAATIATALVALWNADTNTLCTGITAADTTGDFTLTADTAGVAFEVVSSATGGTAALTRAATTPNSGPCDWRNTANWSGGALPGGDTGQHVYIEDFPILYGLDQSGITNAVTLHHRGAQIGTNPADGCLPVYLKLKCTVAEIGENFGAGTKTESTPVLLDCVDEAAVITIHNTGVNSLDSSLPAVWIKTNDAAAKVIVRKGIVGVGWGDAETSTINAVDVLWTSSKTSDSKVMIGAGVTFSGTTPAVNCRGGSTMLRAAVATVNADAGNLQTEGTGAITTMNIKAGATVIPNSTGTIGTANIYGVMDTLKSSAARTITNTNMFAGGVLKLNKAAVTLTNPIVFSESVVLSAPAA